MPDPHSEPADCEARDGAVVERKQDGGEVAMTPAAAVMTAGRLIEAAAAADGDEKVAADLAARRARTKGSP